ncbi:MAG: protein kinase [Chloroflexi bacterium]|nr:protein kinase [Chloroflexota bacterium]
MSETGKCIGCGADLPSDAPKGLCPECLLRQGLEDSATISGGQLTESADAASRTGPSDLGKLHYFGDYELVEEIARGGMGVVYKARQVSLNRTVAVKMILAGQLAREADVKRFHAEAEAAANLQHPNIVAIHEVGEQEGQHYFSMDYVAGKNLAEVAREGPLPARKAALYVRTIAEAIHYAHQRGTLHRDLKPQNVLIDAADQPRITDFGLAKQIEGDSGLTRSGAVLGSPAYMPPEQAAGRPGRIGPPTDVYSIGAILYELLTGRAPFRGETLMATLAKVMDEPPVPPAKLNPRVPRDLETICLKCLEKGPERRYHSARELAEELGRFLNHEPILAKPASPLRAAWSWSLRHPWIITASATVIILGLVGFAYSLWQENAFLHWARSHPNEQPTYALAWFETDSMAIRLFCLGPFLPILPWIDFMVRRRRGDPILGQHLAGYCVIGALQVSIGIFVLMKHIEAKAWHLDSPYDGPDATMGSFYLTSLGLLLLWEVVREHFSEVSGLVVREPLKSDARAKSIFGELLGALGVSPSAWKTGPLAILFLGGPIWFMAAPMPFLPQHGVWITIEALAKALPVTLAICAAAQRATRVFWILTFAALAAMAIYPDPGRESRWLMRNGIWFPLMLTATELPIVLAFCATVKGAARFFWIFGVMPIAALSTIADFGSARWFSFEGWLTATAAGLVLLKVSMRPRQADSHVSGLPEAGDAGRPTQGRREALRQWAIELLPFLAAWACLAMFFAVMVPEFPANYQPRDWFSLLMGISSLLAAAWCLSLRNARASTASVLVVILLFGLWIISVSPYRILIPSLP